MIFETFKDIVGFEDLYQVSNLGNVKSFPKGDGNGGVERILKTDKTRSYDCVSLCKNGKVSRFFNHVLVAKAFIPNPDNKPCVNHKDLNKFNNKVYNLEWVTVSENAIHAFNSGALDTCFENSKQVLAKMRAENQLKTALLKLGSRFISLEYKGYRTHINFNCYHCNQVTSERSDGRRLFNEGRCTSCKVTKTLETTF